MEFKSNIDQSVNFVENSLTGFIEARYVRREENYFVCYLSSQSGCNKGCRFCHLTATKQTTFEDVDHNGFLEQAEEVFQHYRKEAPAKIVHFNFMARGEVLANSNILSDADHTLYKLGEKAVSENLSPKFNLSTIMPRTFDKDLSDVFKIVTPTIYYSLYSVEDKFRKQWLPAAMPVEEALKRLRDYQKISKKMVKIHYAIIKDQNDSATGTFDMLDMIEKHNLVCEFNVVRYNPFSPEQGVEADESVIQELFEIIKTRWHGRAKMITRVGEDVKASCGMFVEKNGLDRLGEAIRKARGGDPPPIQQTMFA